MAVVKRRIIGLVGAAGAGKTTLAGILAERYGFPVVSLTAPVKKFAGVEGNSASSHLRFDYTCAKFHKAFGENILVDTAVLSFIESGHFVCVIDDIQSAAEVERLAWWSVKEDIQVCLWHLTVGEDETRRRLGSLYDLYRLRRANVEEAVKSARSIGMLCGTIAKPVLEMEDEELDIVANWSAAAPMHENIHTTEI